MDVNKRMKLGQAIVNQELGKLELVDLRFWVDDKGLYWPSVTTYLDVWPKGKGFEMWLKDNGDEADRIMEDAGNQGSTVHRLTEDYDNGFEISLLGDSGMKYTSTEWKMLERYDEFSRTVKPKIEEIELKLVVPEMRTGGQLDRVVMIGDKRYLLDIKSSKGVYDSYFLQLACYAKMYEFTTGIKIDGICILWLNAATRTEKIDFKKLVFQGKSWQVVFPEKSIDHYYKLFQYIQEIWWEVNGDMKPKNLSYNLTIKK